MASDFKIDSLSVEELEGIFTGKIKNWKDVGGPEAAIHLYIRDPISGTHLGFRELALENKPYALGPKAFTNYQQLVHGVAADPNGIGYASLDAAQKGGVKVVSISGVAPTTQTVNDGQYPYARLLRFYSNKMKEAPAARAFIEFAQSRRGQEIVASAGDVPAGRQLRAGGLQSRGTRPNPTRSLFRS